MPAPRDCDLIIRNGCVVTLDGERRVFPSGAIAISGNAIAAVGPEAAVLAGWRAPRVIDAQGAFVHPGYVDAHLHVNAHTCRGFFRGDASKGGGRGSSRESCSTGSTGSCASTNCSSRSTRRRRAARRSAG